MEIDTEQPSLVSVIIVTYNSASSIRPCLDSVLAQRGLRTEIIVVDNASADETPKMVQGVGPEITLVRNQENIGFGRGCNQAFQQSSGQSIYFLNPDARLIEPDALAQLEQAMRANPRWGMAATRVVSASGEEEALPATSYPGQSRTKNDFTKLPGAIAWVIGASMFFRRKVFAALKGFDPDFFLYSEETDLCLRMRRLGHEIGLVEGVTVRHIGAVSERGRDPYETWMHKMNGLHLFWRKHYSPDVAAHLVRKDLWRARFRATLNGVVAAFRPSRSLAWEKHRRYSAIRDASAAFLRLK